MNSQIKLLPGETIVYKLVKIGEQDKLYSAWMCNTNVRLEYVVGQTTRPQIKRSKIWAFKTKESAKLWWFSVIVDVSTHKLFKAAAKISKIDCQFRTKFEMTNFIAYRGQIEKFWSIAPADMEELAEGFWNKLPEGTVFCNSLRLLEQVA